MAFSTLGEFAPGWAQLQREQEEKLQQQQMAMYQAPVRRQQFLNEAQVRWSRELSRQAYEAAQRGQGLSQGNYTLMDFLRAAGQEAQPRDRATDDSLLLLLEDV